jgi:ribosomal subunit interface protein
MMQIPLQVTFKGMDRSDAVEARVRERAQKLERFAEHITSCRVVVERATRRHHKGDVYHVRVDVTLPGRELAATRDPERGDAHEDVYVAVRDAFDAMRRQIEEAVRRRRGEQKHHETPPHGRVLAIDADSGRGTIATSDGREVPFARNSVVGADFEQLREGDEVRFSEAAGASEAFASTVHVIGKHHLVG